MDSGLWLLKGAACQVSLDRISATLINGQAQILSPRRLLYTNLTHKALGVPSTRMESTRQATCVFMAYQAAFDQPNIL